MHFVAMFLLSSYSKIVRDTAHHNRPRLFLAHPILVIWTVMTLQERTVRTASVGGEASRAPLEHRASRVLAALKATRATTRRRSREAAVSPAETAHVSWLLIGTIYLLTDLSVSVR